MPEEYEVIIVGGGPAGLTAGLWAARLGLKALLLEREGFGGQLKDVELVEDFPGFAGGVPGPQLCHSMFTQATVAGLAVELKAVSAIRLEGRYKIVEADGESYPSKAVILAGGSQRQKLGVPGEEALYSQGVSYCATCDGPFFRGQPVAVVGGGDTACHEALHLCQFAARVTLVHRRGQLRANQALQQKVLGQAKIDFRWNSIVAEVLGGEKVEGLRLRHTGTGEVSVLPVAGVFIAVGLRPNTDYLAGVVPLTPQGKVITNEVMETAVAGIFAAGGIRHQAAGQAVASAGDGATAALSAHRFMRNRSGSG